MILPYSLRLLCLCLASFFLLHAALGLTAWLATPAAIKLAEKMRARPAARFLFFLRVIPALLAAIVVLGLGVPSYIWLEPRATEESAGLACCAAALLGGAIWCVSIARVLYAALRSSRYASQCKRIGREMPREGASVATSVLDVDAPVIALAGVFRPRVLVSRSVIRALSPAQLEATLRHENAHRISRDNLKRFLFLVAPGIFPLTRSLQALEHAWARFSEWAADDEATRRFAPFALAGGGAGPRRAHGRGAAALAFSDAVDRGRPRPLDACGPVAPGTASRASVRLAQKHDSEHCGRGCDRPISRRDGVGGNSSRGA